MVINAWYVNLKGEAALWEGEFFVTVKESPSGIYETVGMSQEEFGAAVPLQDYAFIQRGGEHHAFA